MNDGAMDRARGKAKEMLGRITGDDRKRAEGRTDRAKGGLRGMRERAKGVRDSLRNERGR